MLGRRRGFLVLVKVTAVLLVLFVYTSKWGRKTVSILFQSSARSDSQGIRIPVGRADLALDDGAWSGDYHLDEVWDSVQENDDEDQFEREEEVFAERGKEANDSSPDSTSYDAPNHQTSGPSDVGSSEYKPTVQVIPRSTITTKVHPKVSLDKIHHKMMEFSLKPYFKLPYPAYTSSLLLQSYWIDELKKFLRGLSTTQVSIVTATDEHKVVVMNWLISALIKTDPPLENVLVLTLSSDLYKLLKSKDIPVICVDPKGLIDDSKATGKIKTVFSQVHIVRMTVFRFINHWGFDVVMYDSDAVVLKNPQPLFDKYPHVDLIGSAGVGPTTLSKKWGRTICTGVLLMRSTENAEHFWQAMSSIKSRLTDQGMVNEALRRLHIQWDKHQANDVKSDMEGECQKHGVKAVILSEEAICRYTCDEVKRSQYYAWHKPAINKQRTTLNKMKRAQEGGAWYLKEDWKTKSSLKGLEWLNSMSII